MLLSIIWNNYNVRDYTLYIIYHKEKHLLTSPASTYTLKFIQALNSSIVLIKFA